jgi:sugar phosphate isomerase/epimerase
MNDEVLGSYWTTAGPVEVHNGREWSLFGWAQRCAEAARTGMAGIGIWHADLEHLLRQRSLAEIRRVFSDHGLRALELEFLDGWFLDEGSPRRKAADQRRALVFEAAAELGARHIKIGNIPGDRCERARLVDAFGHLCAGAARRHEAPLLYELMPFDPNANSLESAVELLAEVNAPNSGLVIDFWHLGKLGINPDRLRTVPPHLLSYVELSDGLVADMSDRVAETTRFRKLPGEGEFDVTGYVAVLRELGYAGPWGVEVLSDELRRLPMPEIFDRAVDTARRSLSGISGVSD